MQVYREVKLADGVKYKIKKVNPLSNHVPDHLKDQFMFLKRQIEGSEAMLLGKKIAAIQRSVDRLERLAQRAEDFIDSEAATTEKREEYFKKLEVFLQEKDNALAQLDEEDTKYTKLVQSLTERSIEVAAWGLSLDPNCMSQETAENLVDETTAIIVVRAMLGLSVDEFNKPEEELRPTKTSENG
jgi:predicted nucleotidyltransferase